MKPRKKQQLAIETKAYGCLFRSRLEARYAVAFTKAHIQWRYEPEGFNLDKAGFYLPDFWLPQVSMWAEVKATKPSDDELRKCALLATATGFPCLLLIDLPDSSAYWAVMPDESGSHSHCWEVSCGGIKAYAMDFELWTGYDYHITESRFFSCTGAGTSSFPMPHESSCDSNSPAVDAARSARFEHGQAPESLPLWKD